MGSRDAVRKRWSEYPDEVIEVAKVVASLGGIYMSHIGSEGMQQDKESTSRFASPMRRRFRSTSFT